MIQLYPHIKLIHICAALASGSLFSLRAVAGLGGGRWGMAAPVRYLSYTIDTVLLGAAVLLMLLIRQYPFVSSWLTVKVLLVAAYIVLGSFALKRARSRRARLLCTAAALLTFLAVVSIARTHSPLGPFFWLR